MPISVTNPVGRAIEQTGSVLFEHGSVEKWFKLGFCAFLAGLAYEGCNFGNQQTGVRGGGPFPDDDLLMVFVIVGVIVGVPLYLLVMWLSSRGTFMFIDGIVRDRGAVKAPWSAYRDEGNRLFKARVWLTFGWLAVIGSGIAAAFLFDEGDHAPPLLALGAGLALLTFFGAVCLLIAQLLLDDFIAPTMYLHRLPVMDAWRTVRAEVVAGHFGAIVLYFLMRLLLLIPIVLGSFVLVLATCCIGALPYLSSVVTLPLSVFYQSYNLHFLQQFGPKWRFFDWPDSGPFCAACGYNLIGSPTNRCSECGADIPERQWTWIQKQRGDR
jgi:hypothetical protein